MSVTAVADKYASGFRAHLNARADGWLTLLETLCNTECGSEMTDGVNAVADTVSSELSQIGFSVKRRDGGRFAPHIVASTGEAGRPIVLGGHLDTTYTDYSALPKFHVTDGMAIGPGTADMKGGIVVFLAAMDCLRESGLLAGLPVAVLLNTDEERGAPTSRAIFQEYARTARAALFGECAGPNGEFVTSRRAKLSYRLDVTGVGRHAGEESGARASALTDLAHRIIEVEALNGRFEGASFNVGRAFGGIASNTVPAEACALIDIRYPKAEQEGPIRAAMDSIAAMTHVTGCGASLTLTSFRPAWHDDRPSRGFIGLAGASAAALGLSATTQARGGTADSNWFGAAGVPCLDGLGPVGFDDHTPKEHIVMDTLWQRALLVAVILAALGEDDDIGD